MLKDVKVYCRLHGGVKDIWYMTSGGQGRGARGGGPAARSGRALREGHS